MDHRIPQDRPLPVAADFIGSPFRLLPRIGDKMYRPARPVTDVPSGRPPEVRYVQPREPGVWDWG